MKKIVFFLIFAFFYSAIILDSSVVYSAETATFDAFYKSSSGHIGWLLAGAGAIISGGVIMFTGGAASPIVVTLGTWIGNSMGLTGIAATNAGLAILGGGSLASGGFGIIGGTVVLTAALSFSTDIVIDFAVVQGDKIYQSYSYDKFAEHSKSLITFPIPKNEDGPKSYVATIKFLNEKILSDQAMSSNSNVGTIKDAIQILSNTSDNTLLSNKISDEEIAKKETLFAILHFWLNEYPIAKEHAQSSISAARKAKIKRTFPSLIYGVCELYEKDIDFDKINQDYFRYSVLADPKNPLIPLLFSIYLDRVAYRFNDGTLDSSVLVKIFEVAIEEPIKEYRKITYSTMLSHYFMRLKIEQQKISSLSLTSNKTIKESPQTLTTIEKSLKEYHSLLNGSDLIIKQILSSSMDLEDKDKKQFEIFYTLLVDYKEDEKRLISLSNDLKDYQVKNGGIKKFFRTLFN